MINVFEYIIVKRMKQEYIKGDIVMYDNKIHTIMDALGVNNYELSCIEHTVHQLELSGVPLTPNILSTNRFKIVRQDESGALYFKDGLGIDIVASYVRNCYDIYISGNKILKDIKYLHQLQHLLFGLGLNSEMEV